MIPMFKVNMANKAQGVVSQVLESGMIGEGPKVAEFTEELKKLFQHSYVTALNSCTSALTLALRLVGCEGRSVVSSPFTMVATNCAIKAAGATIVWGPLDKRTLCLDLVKLQEKLVKDSGTDNVYAVVITLVGGMVPYNLEDFLSWTAAENIAVIFDAAHALTTKYKGKHISHWADYTCFSFQSIKHLTTGDGGALVCNNWSQHRRAEKLKWFGMSRELPPGKTRLEHQMTTKMAEWGYKYHMNDIAASIGLANLQLAKKSVAQSIANAEYYNSFIPDISGPQPPKDCSPSYWVYPIWVKDSIKVMEALAVQNIASTPMWPMNYIHDCFPDSLYGWDDPGGPLFIPNGFWVGKKEREHIAKSVINVVGSL